MAAHVRKETGKRAFEKFKGGQKDFLKAASFETYSLIAYMKHESKKAELRSLARDMDVHPDNRAFAWEALKLMGEPPMR